MAVSAGLTEHQVPANVCGLETLHSESLQMICNQILDLLTILNLMVSVQKGLHVLLCETVNHGQGKMSSVFPY